MIFINLLALNAPRNEYNLFIRLIENNPDIHCFARNNPYTVGNEIVELSHTFLCKVDDQNQCVYQIVSNKVLFSSDKTTVRLIEKIFKLSSDKKEVEYITPQQPLIAKLKFIKTKCDADSDTFRKNMEREYQQSPEHLGSETPVFLLEYNNKSMQYTHWGVMIQKRMPGIMLYTFIRHFLLSDNTEVACSLRLKLIFQLLDVFNRQVLQQDLHHGDLKPENIMIDEKSLTMNIVDYEGSSKMSENRDIFSASKGYSAPEDWVDSQIRPPAMNEKGDMWSLGVIIAFICGIHPKDMETGQLKDPDFKKEATRKAQLLYVLEENQRCIVECMFHAILQLTLSDSDARWSYAVALAYFKEIDTLYSINSDMYNEQAEAHHLNNKMTIQTAQLAHVSLFSRPPADPADLIVVKPSACCAIA